MNLPVRKAKDYPAIVSVKAESDKITAMMSDGREMSIPVAWFPRLMNATDSQRTHMEISPGGYGIHLPEIDEDFSLFQLGWNHFKCSCHRNSPNRVPGLKTDLLERRRPSWKKLLDY